ncbi:MAG: integrase [Arenicella sp.]|jgi:integrase
MKLLINNLAFKKLGLNRKIHVTEQRGIEVVDSYPPLHEVISWHKGRKTATTMALRIGMDSTVVMKLTGHKSSNTLMKCVDYNNKDLEREMKKLSQRKGDS